MIIMFGAGDECCVELMLTIGQGLLTTVTQLVDQILKRCRSTLSCGSENSSSNPVVET